MTESHANLLSANQTQQTSTLNLMPGGFDDPRSSVITEKVAEEMTRSPSVASPVTIHSQYIMQELANREVGNDSNDLCNDNAPSPFQKTIQSFTSANDDSDAQNDQEDGDDSPNGPRGAAGRKEYDELAQTVREAPSPTHANSRLNTVEMKHAAA